MKKVIYLILFIIIISIGYSWYYFNQYHIEDNRTAIQSNLKEWSSKGSGSINPDVIEVVRLNDTSSYIVLFQTQSSNIGYAHIIKGWNGKFKIDHSGHGTNIVDYQKIQTDKGMYGVIIGKNPDLKIDHIIADLDYGDFNFNVSANEKFVKYEKIPNDIEEPFAAELTFYDKEGSVIEVSEFQN
ncbi:hypothetical protein [Alkalibacillus almallahensis]|uniref:hypothetical protein n=1 Tax=Alkalibacillus almallahensis TaxID=1379154 RepID=UPI0014244F0A|nr:hypothetical protein [Alkalibacillus almallahensis]NIK13063.1 uncharacterized protein YxeA [Alkalibacillus almallahensis]